MVCLYIVMLLLPHVYTIQEALKLNGEKRVPGDASHIQLISNEIMEEIEQNGEGKVYAIGFHTSGFYLQEDLFPCIRYFDNQNQHMSVAPEIEEDFIERFEQASPEYIVTTEDYDSSSEKFDVILRSEYESIWTKDGFCIMKKTDE